VPRIDFGKVDDVQEYAPLQPGRYTCRLVDVEETSTQHGDEMWKLRFAVESGPERGRVLFDNLVFSAAAMKRVKLICSRLGLDVSGQLDLSPAMLRGRVCCLVVEIEDYQDREGNSRKRNVVPFAGYESTGGEDSQTRQPHVRDQDDEEDLPF